MKSFPWIMLGTGIVLFLVWNSRNRQYRTAGDANVEDAAQSTFGWGNKQRVTGAAERLTGRLKEGVGRLVGDDNLAGEGVAAQVAGVAKQAVGGLAQAAGDTLHELNRG